MNAVFQRIARRDKKAFLSDQGKEIEENNRMGKTRDLFKKIRDTKETFYAKTGLIKDRNGMDLTEAEDIKKRWQEYSEELYKKRSLRPGSSRWCDHSLEPDILECEVKWALGSITTNKASRCHGIPVEPFQILKDYAVKVLHSIWERSTARFCRFSPCYLTYMQSTSCEMPGWMKHKLESRLPGKRSTTSEMQMITTHCRK